MRVKWVFQRIKLLTSLKSVGQFNSWVTERCNCNPNYKPKGRNVIFETQVSELYLWKTSREVFALLYSPRIFLTAYMARHCYFSIFFYPQSSPNKEPIINIQLRDILERIIETLSCESLSAFLHTLSLSYGYGLTLSTSKYMKEVVSYVLLEWLAYSLSCVLHILDVIIIWWNLFVMPG